LQKKSIFVNYAYKINYLNDYRKIFCKGGLFGKLYEIFIRFSPEAEHPAMFTGMLCS